MIPRRFLLLMLFTAALSACGSENVRETGVGAVFEPGVSKPNVMVGSLEVAIIERPARDRARIRATWRRAAGVDGCQLRMRLPTGAVLVEGEETYMLLPDEAAGVREWVVEFPTGAPLDATVRLCGDAGAGVRLCDSYVRLTR